jgi:uncharacterized membrane protein
VEVNVFTIKKSVIIDTPVKKVFAFMEDPTNLPSIWPSMVEVRNVRKNAKGFPIYDWVYKMAGMKFEGEQDTLEFIKDKHITTASTRGIDSHFDFDYVEEHGKTKMDMKITYSVPVPVIKSLAEQVVGKLNEKEADILLANLKTRMEA